MEATCRTCAQSLEQSTNFYYQRKRNRYFTNCKICHNRTRSQYSPNRFRRPRGFKLLSDDQINLIKIDIADGLSSRGIAAKHDNIKYSTFITWINKGKFSN